ncbi:MAG: T9SS type A sorting domain-containing protein [Bacteroidales bacterium]|nr:T9SS type A sorting domain-containing protein [Bacteroidales bacterium]MDT8431935.1 T9SS type A sorting domain-containing protein [Bacteroidales bacterium]
MKKTFTLIVAGLMLLCGAAFAQEYHFQEDFESGSSDNFAGWITGGEGVASTSGGIDGRGAKFRDAVSTLTTEIAYSWADTLFFSVKTSNAATDAIFSVYLSFDEGVNWTSVWDTTYLELDALPDGTLHDTIVIDTDQTPVMIRFESANDSGDNGDYPFVLDNVWLKKKAVPADNTGFSMILSSCQTVSEEDILFSETAENSNIFVAHDSISYNDTATIDVVPLNSAATASFSRQPFPEAGGSDTAVFTIHAADGVTTETYKVVISRSLYYVKTGFVKSGDARRPSGWSSSGGLYASSSRGNYGLYPGDNGLRMYNSANNGEGQITSPEYFSIGTVSFAAKFSTTDDESLILSTSTDQGATWQELETYLPSDGRIPSYPGEDAADVLAFQSIEVNSYVPTMIRFSYSGISTSPRTMVDDIGVMISKAATVASLNDLKVDGTTIDGFSPEVYAYAYELPAGYQGIPAVSAASGLVALTIEVEDATDPRGSEAERTTTVTVTAPDGVAVQQYTILFTVALNDDATLSDLTIDGTTVSGFASGNLTYDVELPAGTTAVPAVDAVPADANATYVVNDAAQLPGTTTVVVTAEDGTTQETYQVNFTVDATGVPGATAIQMVLSPNPTQGMVRISGPESTGQAVVSVYGITGELLKRIEDYQWNEEVDMRSQFNAGVYFVKATIDNNTKVFRVVVR